MAITSLCAVVPVSKGIAEEPPTIPPHTLSLTDANDLWLSGRYEEAESAFRSFLSDEDKKVAATVGVAKCLERIGKTEEALKLLNDIPDGASAERHLVASRLLFPLGQYDESLSQATKAIEFNKDAAAARRWRGLLLEWLGRRDDAIETYAWFDRQLVERKQLPRDAEWVTESAIGFLRYSVLTKTNVVSRTKHVLNEMLQSAYEKIDRHWWPARIAAGDLLRDKHNNDENDGSMADYAAALKINPNLPEAHVGMGEIALENWDFEGAEKAADEALKINPRFAPAIHLQANKYIVERRYQQATETAEKALAINPRDIAALSIAAAGHACRFDQAQVDRYEERVRAINPRCAWFYRELGDALGGIRQYQASESAYARAIEYDPTDANAHTELGMMYMQWGEEEKAQASLDAAWVLDPFNERTKFTLDLLDSLKKFAKHETEHFIIRFNRETDPGLGEYIGEYLEEIFTPVTTDYDSPLHEKTSIEIFPSHRAFSVRIAGRPWIPTVGACSGKVIALASPRGAADLMGPYNIARVLKHEFTHTVTLAATRNRIPHWFTEGLAVFQEDAPRSFDWAELLADAVRRDQLFTLESVDWGFMRPRRPTDRTLAYAQSEWMCEYIVERFGYDVINKMLARYRGGRTQPEVFRELLAIEMDSFDRDFQSWARKHVENWGFDLNPTEDPAILRAMLEQAPDDAALHGRLARALLDADDPETAVKAGRRAIELNPEEPNALRTLGIVLAHFADSEAAGTSRRGYEDEARVMLSKVRSANPKDWTPPKLLANIALRREEWDVAIELLQQLQRICPQDPLSWRGLSGIYTLRKQDDLALPQLLELARMEERDADVAGEIGRIYRRQNKLRDAQHWFRQAIFIAPLSPELHRLLAESSMQLGDTKTALREYMMLTALEPKKVEHLENAAIAANKLGDATQAADFARRAVALNHESSVKSLIP